MARRKEGLNMSSDFLNFLRFSVTESAAATFTQAEIDTNLSAERGVMMEIHSIEIDHNVFQYFREVAANSAEWWRFQVTRETKTGLINGNDADLIWQVSQQITRAAAIGTDTGPLYALSDTTLRVDFPLPIPYVKPSIFVNLQATAASPTTVYGRIGYTLREVSREEFLELLVALQ